MLNRQYGYGVVVYEPMTLFEIRKTIEVLEDLEKRVFDYLWYPKITYKNQRLLSSEDAIKELINTLFVDLFSNIRVYWDGPLYRILKKYEALYKVYCRVQAIRPRDNFYEEALKKIFFFIYEARTNLADIDKRETFLDSFKIIIRKPDDACK